MENKMLLVRRLIYCACVILSLVFISFKGGNLPYMIFSMMVINTVAAVVYILYVYFTIRIYQVIPERRVTKQEFVPYNLKLNNESVMAYRDVKLTFFTDFSEVKGASGIGCIGLEPGEGRDIHKELFCNYSGTYFIGVDTIEIMDYFKIFRIRFQMPQKMKVTVKPRVIPLDNISFLSKAEAHASSLWGKSDFSLDNEVRKYYPGDNKRHIHWKNSAKRQELMVRSLTSEEITEYVVILDGSMGKLDFNEKIVCCDKLREVVLAMTNYIYEAGYYARVILDTGFDGEVTTKRQFNDVFNRLIDYGFGPVKSMAGKLYSLDAECAESVPFILITSNHSQLDKEVVFELSKFRNVAVINVDLYESIEDVFS